LTAFIQRSAPIRFATSGRSCELPSAAKRLDSSRQILAVTTVNSPDRHRRQSAKRRHHDRAVTLFFHQLNHARSKPSWKARSTHAASKCAKSLRELTRRIKE